MKPPTKLVEQRPLPSSIGLRSPKQTALLNMVPGSRIFVGTAPGSTWLLAADLTDVGGTWVDQWNRPTEPRLGGRYELNYSTYPTPQRLYIVAPDGIMTVVRASSWADLANGMRIFVGTGVYHAPFSSLRTNAEINRLVANTMNRLPETPTEIVAGRPVAPAGAVEYAKPGAQGNAYDGPILAPLGYYDKTIPNPSSAKPAFFGITPGSQIYRAVMQGGTWQPGRNVTSPGEWRGQSYVINETLTSTVAYLIISPDGSRNLVYADSRSAGADGFVFVNVTGNNVSPSGNGGIRVRMPPANINRLIGVRLAKVDEQNMVYNGTAYVAEVAPGRHTLRVGYSDRQIHSMNIDVEPGIMTDVLVNYNQAPVVTGTLRI